MSWHSVGKMSSLLGTFADSLCQVIFVRSLSVMEGGDMGEYFTAAPESMAVTFAGLAKAAYEEGFRYANERIQGGVPIFEHNMQPSDRINKTFGI